LHSNYGNYISKASIKQLNTLLIKAHEKKLDKVAWELYLSLYPYMIKEELKAVEFEEFKQKLTIKQEKYTQISNEEIIDDIEKVVQKYKLKG
jgi:hypothetical protein